MSAETFEERELLELEERLADAQQAIAEIHAEVVRRRRAAAGTAADRLVLLAGGREAEAPRRALAQFYPGGSPKQREGEP